MDGSKKNGNIVDMKENGENKIPSSKIPERISSVKFSSAKETRSKTSATKTTTIIATKTSKPKQNQVTNLPKNVKRMSVAQISKDVMNHFQEENLKSDDHCTESDVAIKIPDKENIIKRAPLKEKYSQASQKQYRSLSKKTSAPDLKTCTAFGGIRFATKRNTCRKFDIFQKISKDPQAVAPEACPKELRRSASASGIPSKEVEWSNEGKLEDPPTVTAESSNARPLTVKETTVKKYKAFGGIRFTPKWQSTPLKPDLFENVQKVSKHDKKSSPQDSSANPNSTKEIRKEDEIITIDETITLDETVNIDETITLDGTFRSPSEEPKCLKSASITVKEIGAKIYPAFAGMRLTPKRKSTHPKPDMFEAKQELKIEGQESHISGTSEKIEMSSAATKVKIKTETLPSPVEMLEQTSIQKAQFSETVSVTVKKSTQVKAFASIRFAPKWKSTPIRSDMFDGIKKETKTDLLESHHTDSCSKELKTIPASAVQNIKVVTQLSNEEKLELLTTQKPESSKNDEASKRVVPPAFGGLRFKPRQKKLHDVFEAQKSKDYNKMQS